jgi:hypothetical protein
MERREYSTREESSVGVCHSEGLEGRKVECHYGIEIRWVRKILPFTELPVLSFTRTLPGNGCTMEIVTDKCSPGTF